MTRRSPSAPRQVKLIQEITEKLNSLPYVFVTDDEQHTGNKIPEGDWLHRVNAFLDDPESRISADPFEREFTIGMITRRYSKYLDKKLVSRLTRCLDPVIRSESSDRQERLEKVKRDIKKITDK